MSSSLRAILVAVVAVQALVAAAFAFQLPAAIQLWPLPYTSALSFTFIASIAAAAAASTLWCVLADEPAALAGIALDYVTITVAVGLIAAQLATGSGGPGDALAVFAAACAATALAGGAVFAWSARRPFRDARPAPRPVLLAFAVFIVALLAAGSQLAQGSPAVLPWAVSTEAAAIYGWSFIGAAVYFAYGLLRRRWANAGGQLAGFLAYDLVLLVPLLRLLPTVSDALRPNLLLYLAVLIASGALAVYYLFLAPATGVVAARAAGVRPAGSPGHAVVAVPDP
jgi:hypothetical protein